MFFSEGAQTQMGEPKIVPELLTPLNDNNKILVIFIKSPHYEIRVKNANYMGEGNPLQ